MTPSDLRRIAAILRREARGIRDSHTLHQDWHPACDASVMAAKSDYAEMRALAKKCADAAIASPTSDADQMKGAKDE